MHHLRSRLALVVPAVLVVVTATVASFHTSSAQAAMIPLPAPGVTALVSAAGTGPANGDSAQTSISDDGRFVAFTSNATDLIGLPTRGNEQVYVRDMTTGVSQMVSINSSGSAGGNGHSHNPSISGDGTTIAFTSEAMDLDGTFPLTDDHSQIYVRDMSAGATRLVTRNIGGTAGGRYNSFSPALSGDGTKLAFASIAPDLLAGVGNGAVQIYTGEMVAGSMKVKAVVSTADADAPVPGQLGSNDSYGPSISRDGTAIVFYTASTNLTADSVPVSVNQVFARSLTSGRTQLVSVAGNGPGAGDADSAGASVSADGKRVAFTSKATNLTANSPHSGIEQIYVRDMSHSTSELVSVTGSGAASSGKSVEPSISGDGRRVAFSSNAEDIVRADTRGVWQVYWRDTASQLTMLASSTHADPTRGGEDPFNSMPTYPFSAPRISSDGTHIAFSAAANLLTAGSPGPPQLYLHGAEGPRVDRIGGADRYAVSAAVSAATFPPGVPVAYVASGAVFSDALSGSAAAGAQGAPVLLVGKDEVPESIAGELRRLHPASIVVLGGADTISARVESALGAFGAPVSRIAGSDRFAVSAAISAARFPKGTPTVYVASGEVFPDALSGSAAAGLLGGPVLLVSKDSIPTSVSAELTRLAPNDIVVLGGSNTISDAVASNLGKKASAVRRIGGADRFDVSAGVSQDVFPNGQSVVYVASGAVFPDALSGSAAAIADRAPVLLVTRDSIPASVVTQLQRLKPYRIVVLGGTNTISDTVRDALDKYLVRP